MFQKRTHTPIHTPTFLYWKRLILEQFSNFISMIGIFNFDLELDFEVLQSTYFIPILTWLKWVQKLTKITSASPRKSVYTLVLAK